MLSLTAVLSEHDVVGVLGRDITVLVVEIGRSGCLLESPSRVEPGGLGLLRLIAGAREFRDAVRIARCQEVAGAGERFHLGAEFIWLEPPEEHSIRTLASRLFGADGVSAASSFG
jgi:hypothetical protein